MIFSNRRSYIPTNQKNMTFTNTRRNTVTMQLSQPHVPQNVQVVKSKPYVERVEYINQKKKITWGEPFWNLFHVLAEKVNEYEFYGIRKEFLNIIYTICSNLPCPDCTNHAVHYLNGINFNTIQTKEDLKNMLYNFHNAVNARKSFPIFPREKLEEKYKCGKTIMVIEQFLYFFNQRHYSMRLLADDLHRQRLTKSLTSWFKENLKHFES